MYKSLCFSFMAIALLVSLAGCNRNLALHGKVTFADDGTPLTVGTVIFDDGKYQAKGPIQPDGTYVAGFQKAANGIPKGTYGVRIVGAYTGGKTITKPGGLTGDTTYTTPEEFLIDRKYLMTDTSGLMFKADGSTDTFDIQVDRYKP